MKKQPDYILAGQVKPARYRRHAREKWTAKGSIDIPFFILVMMLVIIGLIMLFSASYPTGAAYAKYNNDAFYFIRKQAVFAVVGLFAMLFVSRINYQIFRLGSVAVLGLAFLLLIAVVVPGLGVSHNNATRWLKMFLFFGPEYQPSEVAKLGVILFFASSLSKRRAKPELTIRQQRNRGPVAKWAIRTGLWEMVWPYGAILIGIGGLMLMEPHMSGTILIMIAGVSILFAAGTNWKWYAAGLGGGGAVLALIMHNTTYMKARIETWRDPWDAAASSSSAYQITQSLMAVGSGGVLGKGLGQSIQKYGYLPECYNDFVFAIVAEELGYVGCLIIVALFAMLVIRGYWISLHAKDRFGSLLVVGIMTLLATQTFLNIAVVTNFIPTTGISLPFFSYGGTALVIQMAEMGVVLGVSRQIGAQKEGN